MYKPSNSEPLDFFAQLANKFRPDVSEYYGEERMARVNDVIGVLYTMPLSIIGLVWLVAASDLTLIKRQVPLFVFMVAMMVLLNRWNFYTIADMGAYGGGSYGNAVSSLDGVIRWSSAFLLGPIILWVDVVISAYQYLDVLYRGNTSQRRWAGLRTLTFNLTTNCFFPLISLAAYRFLGGTYPISGLSIRTFVLGSSVILIQFLLENILLWTGYLGYTLWKMRHGLSRNLFIVLARLLAIGLLIPLISNLFATPLAGLYVTYGTAIYLTFALGLLAMSWLAHQMSQAVEDSRAQTIQLRKLEDLGRAILNAPPDNSTLPELLTEHATAMFTYARMAIWLDDDNWLLKQPLSWGGEEIADVKSWLEENPQALALHTKDALPWLDQPSNQAHRSTLIAPILAVEDGSQMGGIFLEIATLGQSRSRHSLNSSLPTVQSLAAQIASALHQSVVYDRLLAHQKTQNELEFARLVQAGFLPSSLPETSGWQLAASLEPAREMAGDFYDVIELPSGCLGILIADVADKGVGPALYMALSRTLIRTFAMQYDTQPEEVFRAANERILQDAGESLFVTAFYGVLDPQSGNFTYVNAGHNPPFMLQACDQGIFMLPKPQLPLGIEETMQWTPNRMTINDGDVLFLYTDGAVDAENAEEEMFGMERIPVTLGKCKGLSAEEVRSCFISRINEFTGSMPQFDDITLMVVRRGDPYER